MLFGHLASRFSAHPENLATEAVALIVNRSAAMREALRRLHGPASSFRNLRHSILRRVTTKGTFLI